MGGCKVILRVAPHVRLCCATRLFVFDGNCFWRPRACAAANSAESAVEHVFPADRRPSGKAECLADGKATSLVQRPESGSVPDDARHAPGLEAADPWS